MRDIERIVHAAQIIDQQSDFFLDRLAAELHEVSDFGIARSSLRIFGIESNDLREVHGVGGAVDDVRAVIGEGSAGLMRHGVYDAEQRVGEGHTGKALCIVHTVALLHIAVVGIDQILLDHLDGVQRERIGVIAVRGRDIGLDGVRHGIHTGMCDKFFRHGFRQIGIYDRNVGRDLEIGDRIFDPLLIIGDDGEGGHLGSGTGGRGDRAEMRFCTELRQTEHFAHILEGNIGVFVLDPHGLGGIDGGAAAHGYDPVGLELLHFRSAAHHGFDRRIGFNPFDQGDLHACFFQVGDGAVEESEFLHTAAADADDGALSFKGFEGLQSALAVIEISR